MTKTKVSEIAWLAGLLEGDGSFSMNRANVIHIQIAMTDGDVVLRAHRLLRGPGLKPREYTRDHKDRRTGLTTWCETRLSGRRAAGWMMTLYTFMGERRKSRIRELLLIWRNQ